MHTAAKKHPEALSLIKKAARFPRRFAPRKKAQARITATLSWLPLEAAFRHPKIGTQNDRLGLLWPLLAALWPLWAALGPLLCRLGRSLAALGRSLAALGRSGAAPGQRARAHARTNTRVKCVHARARTRVKCVHARARAVFFRHAKKCGARTRMHTSYTPK